MPCPSCQSDRVEAAVIEGAAIRPEAVGTLKRVFNVGGQVHCRVCLGCGAIFDLRADPVALAKMLE